TSDRDGLIGSGASFTTTRLSAGTHVITASATDRGGLTGQALRTVVVRPPNAPPAVSIAAPANGTSLLTGKPVLLAATATDAEDGDLAAAIRWSSSRDGALGTGGAVVVPSLSVGTHTLSVSATDRDGATTTATVTLNVVPTTVTFAAVAGQLAHQAGLPPLRGLRPRHPDRAAGEAAHDRRLGERVAQQLGRHRPLDHQQHLVRGDDDLQHASRGRRADAREPGERGLE